MKKDLINIAKFAIITLVVVLFAEKRMMRNEIDTIKQDCIIKCDSLKNELWYQHHKFDSLQTCSDVELLVYSGLAKIN